MIKNNMLIGMDIQPTIKFDRSTVQLTDDLNITDHHDDHEPR